MQILQISEAGLAISVLKLKADGDAKLFLVCFELDVFSNTSAVLEWLLSLLSLCCCSSEFDRLKLYNEQTEVWSCGISHAGIGNEKWRKHVLLALCQ